MPTGTVKWFNHTKGYGLIMADRSNEEIFLHINALIRADIKKLLPGQRISYKIESFKGRKAATNLQILDPDSQ